VAVVVYIHGFDSFCKLKYSRIISGSSVKKCVVTVLEDVVGIFHTYLSIQAAITVFMDV
jgi:hypothetical protein